MLPNKKVLIQVLTVLSAITTIWGIVAVFNDVAQWTNTKSAAYATALVAAIACSPMILSLFRASFGKLFGLENAPNHILLHASQQWTIHKDLGAEVVSEKKMFFIQPPEPALLFDIAFGSEALNVHQPNYESNDAKVTSIERLPSGYLRIYWQPRAGAIKPGEPYSHHCKVNFPAPKPGTLKVITIAAAIYTVKLDIGICSELPIRTVKLVKGEADRLLDDPEEIERFVSEVRVTGAPPAKHAGDRVAVVLEELPPRCPYYLLIYFDVDPGKAASPRN